MVFRLRLVGVIFVFIVGPLSCKIKRTFSYLSRVSPDILFFGGLGEREGKRNANETGSMKPKAARDSCGRLYPTMLQVGGAESLSRCLYLEIQIIKVLITGTPSRPANNIVFDYENGITVDSSDLTKFNFTVILLTRSRQFQFRRTRGRRVGNKNCPPARPARQSSKFELRAKGEPAIYNSR